MFNAKTLETQLSTLGQSYKDATTMSVTFPCVFLENSTKHSRIIINFQHVALQGHRYFSKPAAERRRFA